MPETIGNSILGSGTQPVVPQSTKLAAKGLPASLGTARPPIYTGIVFRAESPAEAASIPEGALLVVKETNPDYVFAMAKSGGIVTEIGGMASHAAITSRELKKPAIVGAKDVMSKVRTGDRVIMDIAKGSIFLV